MVWSGVGWPEPILADSGNGAHLLYRIDLPANDDGLVKRVLEGLAFRFDDAEVRVDTTTHNPARIWKLYGTLAAKGDDTDERPHRLARLTYVPEQLVPITQTQLETAALDGREDTALVEDGPEQSLVGSAGWL